MIDHVTCYGIRVHTRPTRSDILVNNLHYKKEKSLKDIHDYVLLPRYLVFTVLCYMELFGRSQSIFVCLHRNLNVSDFNGQ